MSRKGIGVSVPRKEDRRHLYGQSSFIADLRFPKMLDVAFLRSPVAHAHLEGFEIDHTDRARVFTLADLPRIKPILAEGTITGYQSSPYPVMADNKITFVGQILVACVGKDRAEAEDIAERVFPLLDELDAVTSPAIALDPQSPLVNTALDRNVFYESTFGPDLDYLRTQAPVKVTRTYYMSRQAAVPMECRGVIALWDDRAEQLVVYSSTQSPHLIRNALCDFLGIEQNRLRVIAPDVGGGFGYKAILHPEELIIAALALELKRPVRWIEDRREHLTAGASSREHVYSVTAYSDERGKILGLDAELMVDAGAYSVWPHTACFDALQAAGILPGPYLLQQYRIKTCTAVTNKPPIQAYRAVARPSACFATELTIDAVARAVGREPFNVRMENLVPSSLMPYTSVTGKTYDSGDYTRSLQQAFDAIDLPALRREQAERLRDGRPLLGIGFATYTEHTGVSTNALAPMGTRLMPGVEQASVRVTPDGGLEIRTGVQSHGQGMETSYAQVACEVLGVDTDTIQVLHGDTALTPYSTGTYASRCMIMVGGAVAAACDELLERMKVIAAHLLQIPMTSLSFKDGTFHAGDKTLTIKELANTFYFSPARIPEDSHPGGLDVTSGYRPETDTGAFAFSSHVAIVELDRDFFTVKLRDYVAVDDCGVQVNPMIVEGQILGGIVQGIGTAMFEEVPYDESGQPQASTLADYLVPGASDLCEIRLFKTETPSPHTRFGIKGVGEGGAIAPPAAIVNAVNDALAPFGVEISEVPVTPNRIRRALEATGDVLRLTERPDETSEI
jgi:aerobic carbon-monoxide dehydrogenase large subunit